MTYQKPEGLPEKIQHFIDGKFVDSIGGQEFDVIEPVSNEVYITSASAQPEDVELAVAAAKRAFDEGPWPKMLPRERSRILQQSARNRIEGDAVIRAPAAGRLSGLLVGTGQAVQVGQPLLSIIPADVPLEVELWLPANASGMVQAGTPVTFRE